MSIAIIRALQVFVPALAGALGAYLSTAFPDIYATVCLR